MKQLPGLIRFMKFNGLDDDHLETACSYFEHGFFPRGTYIFKQGEQSQRFYGIIRGRVSIRIRKHNIPFNKYLEEKELPNGTQHNNSNATQSMNKTFFTNTQPIVNLKNLDDMNSKANAEKEAAKMNTTFAFKALLKKKIEKTNTYVDDYPYDVDLVKLGLEDEIMVVSNGMCFGEWALIYNIPRTASAFAAEDTELFVMDKDCFDLVFNKAITRADNEKKNFIVKRIPSLKIAGKVHEILKKIFPIFCDNKKLIYTEHDTADSVFLVYQGECALTRLYPDRKAKNGDEIVRNKEKLVTHMHIDRGGLGGLEVVTGAKQYSYNMVCSKDHTIVYKISLKVLKECNRDIVEYLMPLFKQQVESLKDFREKYENISDHFKLTQRNKFNNFKYTSLEVQRIEEQKENEVKKMIEEVKYIKKIPKNIVTVKRMEVSPVQEGYYAMLKRSKHRRGGGEVMKTLTTLKPYPLGRMSLVKTLVGQAIVKSTGRRIAAKPFGLQVFQEANQISHRKSGLMTLIPKKELQTTLAVTNEEESRSHSRTNSAFHYLHTENTSKIPSSSKENNSSNKILNSKISSFRKSLEYSPEKDQSPGIKINEFENINLDKIDKYKPSIHIKYNTSLKNAEHLNMKKPVSQTLTIWNKTINESLLNYNSGAFNLPLISLSQSVTKLPELKEYKIKSKRHDRSQEY